ncbi:hypothetical protein EVAR_52286_1 [Eumeta japonica]|uniref:Uncharacterized protein n=1 Tax=Eumeta variegata TaxID=151549 RepID=A0A4C1ZQL7_EUMVA|nr:hypothetical protein EVAR_52286_1 [Eumeta japonica]
MQGIEILSIVSMDTNRNNAETSTFFSALHILSEPLCTPLVMAIMKIKEKTFLIENSPFNLIYGNDYKERTSLGSLVYIRKEKCSNNNHVLDIPARDGLASRLVHQVVNPHELTIWSLLVTDLSGWYFVETLG